MWCDVLRGYMQWRIYHRVNTSVPAHQNIRSSIWRARETSKAGKVCVGCLHNTGARQKRDIHSSRLVVQEAACRPIVRPEWRRWDELASEQNDTIVVGEQAAF